MKGTDPPATPTVAEPSDPPLQFTFVTDEIVAAGPGSLFTNTFVDAVHQLLSVMETEYDPVNNDIAESFTLPPGNHK